MLDGHDAPSLIAAELTSLPSCIPYQLSQLNKKRLTFQAVNFSINFTFHSLGLCEFRSDFHSVSTVQYSSAKGQAASNGQK